MAADKAFGSGTQEVVGDGGLMLPASLIAPQKPDTSVFRWKLPILNVDLKHFYILFQISKTHRHISGLVWHTHIK